MLDSQGFVRLMLAWHCFCSQIGTYSHVDSKAALYPGTFKFIYNYKGTPLLLCVLVSIYNCTFLTVWKLQSPGYKAGSEDKVHMEPFLHIIDHSIGVQGIFSFCISWKEYSVFVFLGTRQLITIQDISLSCYKCCVHDTGIISIKIPTPGLVKMKRHLFHK